MLGCPVERARSLLSAGKEAYPSITEMKKRVWTNARERGGVIHTLYGRRLVYPNLLLPKIGWDERDSGKMFEVDGEYIDANEVASRRAEAERQVFNGLIQGTASDILKQLAIRSMPPLKQLDADILALVHDELLSETVVENGHRVQAVLNQVFNQPPEESLLPGLPITASASIGKSWYEVKGK